MDVYEIAKEYAQALLELGEEKKALSELEEEFRAFFQLLSEDKALRVFVEAPHISVKEKIQVLRKGLEGRLSPLFLNFLCVLAERGRFLIFREIYQAFLSLVDEKLQRVRAYVRSARSLPPELQQEIRQALEEKTQKQVILQFEIDPRLLGGIVLRIGDVQIDGSLRAKLEQFKQRMLWQTQKV